MRNWKKSRSPLKNKMKRGGEVICHPDCDLIGTFQWGTWNLREITLEKFIQKLHPEARFDMKGSCMHCYFEDMGDFTYLSEGRLVSACRVPILEIKAKPEVVTYINLLANSNV